MSLSMNRLILKKASVEYHDSCHSTDKSTDKLRDKLRDKETYRREGVKDVYCFWKTCFDDKTSVISNTPQLPRQLVIEAFTKSSLYESLENAT